MFQEEEDLTQTAISRAEEIYRRLVEVYPREPRFLERYAEILEKAGKTAAARAAWQKLKALLMDLGMREEAARVGERMEATLKSRGTEGNFLALVESEGLLDRLVARMRQKRLEPGAYLYRMGDEPDGAHLVVDGELEVYGPADAHGHPILLNRIGKGGVVGEMGLFSGRPRSADVIAGKPTTVLHMPAGAFQEALARHPELRRRMQEDAAVRERISWLSRSPLLARLPLADRRELARAAETFSLAPGFPMLEQGALVRDGWLIASGEALLTVEDSEGRSHRVGVWGPGEILGCVEGKFPCSVSARTPLVALRLPASRMADIFQAHHWLQVAWAAQTDALVQLVARTLAAVRRAGL